ncbi:hypothetical protein D9619_001965 [Psilocybe cf. subviscida]|uniref:C2H2-type domain-containing protein n=1 Tax=Psilocybe cf. subviscida TaxID=2480587 RepID=A0A8H5BGR8_9AGAR|nr:hypothetical protein D9619_001965 [Psilocybe cf. subviscida]
MDASYPAASSSRTKQEAVADNITGESSAERCAEDGSWRPPAKKPSSLQSRYAASQWKNKEIVPISRPPVGAQYSSDSRKRYKRDEDHERHRDDYEDVYAYQDRYRKTSANLFGTKPYEVTRDLRSLLTHPTSDIRTAPPSSAQSTVASSSTPSTSSPRDGFSFRSSRDPESVPTTPEQYSRPYHHPHSGRHSDEEEEEEERLVSATKLMRVQSTSRGVGPRIDYVYRKDSSRELPPPARMRTTRSTSPPRASGSSQSHSSGIDEDEGIREASSRHPLPPPHSAPVVSPNFSSRVSNWVGDVDRRTPHHVVQSPPPIAHMPAPSFEPRATGPSYPEFRRPPHMQQPSYASTKSTGIDEDDLPNEEETDELEDSGNEGSDGDAETSARPSLKRGSSSGQLSAAERPSAGGVKNLKNNGIHYCPHCVASFRRNFDMNRHIASIHAERTDLTCPGCPSRSRPFSRRDALRRHLKSVINQNPTPRRRICNLTPAEASSIMERLSK